MSSNQLHKLRVLHLYRNLLREGAKFSDYNFRHYALRRTRTGFRENKSISNKEDIERLMEFGRTQLQVVHRQAVISNLYPGVKSVMTFKK